MSNTDDQLLKLVARMDQSFGWFMRFAGKLEVMPLNKFKRKEDDFFCRIIPGCRLWQNLIASIFNSMDETSRDKAFESHFPNGASLQQILHFSQLINSGNFQYYDYGKRMNLQKYGEEKPPLIDVTNIKDVPIALFVGAYDTLANVNDARKLRKKLESCVFYREFESNHASFITGKDMSYFERIIELTNYYNPVIALTPN